MSCLGNSYKFRVNVGTLKLNIEDNKSDNFIQIKIKVEMFDRSIY